ENLSYLASLPQTVTQGDFTLAHGTPREPVWEYMAYQNTAKTNFHYFATRFCLVGHTHIPLIFVDRGDLWPESLTPDSEYEFVFSEARAIANPGSVGQPRDGIPHAAYAVIDTD